MRIWKTTTYMTFAFVIGFASTYSCGGGSSSEAADYAPLVHTHDAGDITGGIDAATLDGSSAGDFAPSTVAHALGVYRLSPMVFKEYGTSGVLADPFSARYVCDGLCTAGFGWAPLILPFKCRITGLEAQVYDDTDTGYVMVRLYSEMDAEIGMLDEMASLQTGYADAVQWTTLSTALDLVYDPADDVLYGIELGFVSYASAPDPTYSVESQRLRWIRIYYELIGS